jgi:uncharacterized delta-60 repeat protein
MGASSNRLFVWLVVAAALIGTGAFAPRAGATPGPGSLDPSFGDGGHVFARTATEPAAGEFTAAAREPDGDLVVETRYVGVGEESVREIQMRNPTGALVLSFGSGGRVVVDGDSGAGLAVLENGDIVVGTERCGGALSLLEVLEPSGAKAAGFGEAGCVPEVGLQPERIAVDPQGRILVGGRSPYCPCSKNEFPHEQVVITRVLPDGSIDPAFGREGHVGTHTDLGLKGEAVSGELAHTGIGATPEGGVVFGTEHQVIHLEPDGSLDPAYGTGGVAPAPPGTQAMVVEPDGSVVAVTSESQHGQGVSRLTPTGAPDPTFGTAGTLSLSTRIASSAELISPAPRGGYLIAGQGAPASACDRCESTPFLERVTAAGKIDRGYGKNGIAPLGLQVPPDPKPFVQRAIVIGPDGSTFVFGRDYSGDAIVVARSPSGAAEKSFGRGGALIESHGRQIQLAPTGLALTRDDGLAVSIERFIAPGASTGFRADFAADGRQLHLPGGSPVVGTSANGTSVSVGTRGIAIWPGDEPRNAHALFSASPDGRPIRGYGRHGNGRAKFPKGFVAEGIAAAPGGGILAFGAFEHRALAAFRIGPNGRPVRGFGDDGLATLPFSSSRSNAFAGLVEADGSVVLTGEAGYRFLAVRFLSDGRLDLDFGRGGRVRGLPGGSGAGGLIAPSGKGVVINALKVKEARYVSAGLVRLDSRGRLDRTFGDHGFVHSVSERHPLALFTGGDRIVLVNDPVFEEGHKGGGVELRGYEPDGSVDRAFGTHGVRFFGAGPDEEHVFTPAAAVQQSSGKVVVAGTARDGRRARAELVRFLVR